jgi:hypothetical protein
MAADRTEGRSNAEWLRRHAQRFSALAEKAIIPEVKMCLLEIAREYEHLADKTEASQAGGPTDGER